MAINDFNIGFLGKLDGTRSKNQINQDIEALKKSLNSLEIKATLDPKQSQALTKQLNLIQVSLSDASFSPKALNDLVSQVNNALKGIQINIPNINTSTAGKSATQAGQQIGKLVSDSAEKAIGGVSSKGIGKYFRIDENTSNEFRSQMQNLVKEWTNAKGEMTDLKIDTRTFYDKDTEENIERLHQATVTYKNDLDEVIKKTIAWRQIGEQPVFDTAGSPVLNKDGSQQMEAIRGFVEVSGQYSKALEKTSIAADNFADKQVKLQTSLANSLNSIKSAVSDQNSSKPIKDQSNISSLQSQYQIIEQAIANVGNASKSTYAQMEADARTQISVLQDMVKQYRNAENVATSLRTKDFSTVKDVQVQKLQEFKNKISGSNVSIAQMQSDLNNLDTALNGAFDAKTLTDYLNQLDVAQAKFQQLNTQIASANRNEKVQIKVDGLQSNINEFAQLSTEANNFKTTVNGVEVSVQSLTSDLKNVKSQGDFSVVNEKWKSFSSAAKAAGLSVINVTSNITKMATEQRRLSQAGEMQKWLQNNSKATKTFGNDINTMIAKLRSVDDLTVPELEKIRTEFQKIQISARETNKIGFSFMDSIKNQAAKFTQWVSLSSVIMTVAHGFREAGNELKEVNTQLTEISKANDALSSSELAKIGNDSFDVASKYGKKATDYLSGVQEMSRAGYEDATGLAELSTAAQGAGDMTAELANKYIVATDKAYKLNGSVAELTKTLDGVNFITNNNAVNMTELANAMSVVGSTAASFGVDADEATAALGTMIATTQQSGEDRKSTRLNSSH